MYGNFKKTRTICFLMTAFFIVPNLALASTYSDDEIAQLVKIPNASMVEIVEAGVLKTEYTLDNNQLKILVINRDQRISFLAVWSEMPDNGSPGFQGNL